MLKGQIDFELAVVISKKVGAGFMKIVADLGGKYENENEVLDRAYTFGAACRI